jgi:2-amino-4-hydroxy-6-hydroxymethyldihydropteridine diphosphokinase
MNKAYLGIGTNIGDREENLKSALIALNLLPTTKVLAISKVYETDPVGFAEQDNFLNIAVEIETALTAQNILGACLGIEAGLGRIRTFKNGPRVIDIDLLLFEDEKYDTPSLVLPHPRMFEREFVLRPLLDIEFNNPLFDREWAQNTLTGDGIKKYLDEIKID